VVVAGLEEAKAEAGTSPDASQAQTAGGCLRLDSTFLAPLSALGPCAGWSVDTSDGSQVESLFKLAVDFLENRLDALVHAAGISGRRFGDGPLHDCSDDAWHKVIRVNSFGPFLTNRAAVRLMLEQPQDSAGLRGAIVNIGSALDRAPSPVHFGITAYAASKGAVRALTLTSAARYAPDRIRFNLLIPGLIDTPMTTRATTNPEIRAYVASRQPIAAGPGLAADVAEAALYLCEPASRFVTGTELVVDGGWCITDGS
jgi:NAD(P)-dependent dehydrogenase (short-subunit alcohol dehydrogenase family)